MNLTSTRYSFTCAYLKGEESRGVAWDHIDSMLQRSASLKDALEAMKNTDIGEYLWEQPIHEVKDVDAALWRYQETCLDRLDKFSLPRDIVNLMDIYIKKHDILNTKIALRGAITDETTAMAPLGTIYRQGRLDELSRAESIQEICDTLVKSSLSEYIVILEAIKDMDQRSLIEGEVGLDNRYNHFLMESLSSMDDGEIMTKALGIIIDTTNLQILFRAVLGQRTATLGDLFLSGGHMLSENMLREFLSLKPSDIVARLESTEYHLMAQDMVKAHEKEGVITTVDRTIDRHKYRFLRDLLSPRVLSPCNLLWYLLLKELEVRNVRLLLKTLMDGISPSEIREYLVILS